jgi:hypothetical protein
MRITHIKFKTNAPSPGNKFIHEHVELEAELECSEPAKAAFSRLRDEARAMLGLDVDQDDVDAAHDMIDKANETLARAKRAGVL